MVRANHRPSRSRLAIIWVAIVLVLLAGIVIDKVTPTAPIMTPVYAVAVLIAAWCLTERDVIITSILAIIADAYSALVSQTPITFTLFYLAALILICILAFIVSDQRLRIGDLLDQQVRLYTNSERQRAQLQTILEHAPSGIVFVDAQTGEVLVNPALEGLIGRTADPEAGREQYLSFLRRPDGQPVPLDELPSSQALRTHRTIREEFLIIRPDGRAIQVVNVAAPVCGQHGQVIGAIAVFQDITSYKELERGRQEWTSIIAHDLRQPATVIAGYAGLIARKAARSDPSLVRSAEHIHEAANSLSRMISDLLDVTRIETHRLVLKKASVDLPALIHNIVEREEFAARGHPVSVTQSGEIPLIEADPLRIEQVIDNLLSNAAKYGYARAPIRVELARQNGEVEVSVINEGEGISPSEIPKLFTRFYRTPEAQQGKVAGLGLGLSIVKGLVEAHHGRVWVESTPGKTTTFHFTLPIAPAQPPPSGF